MFLKDVISSFHSYVDSPLSVTRQYGNNDDDDDDDNNNNNNNNNNNDDDDIHDDDVKICAIISIIIMMMMTMIQRVASDLSRINPNPVYQFMR